MFFYSNPQHTIENISLRLYDNIKVDTYRKIYIRGKNYFKDKKKKVIVDS